MIDTKPIEAEAQSLAVQAADVVVTDAPSYESAGAFLTAIKTYRAKVAATFDPHIKSAHAAHKALLATKAEHDAAPAKAEQQVKQAMLTWQREEQRRLDEARRQAEAEAQRIAEEQARAQAAEDRRIAEEHALAAAQLAEDAGEGELAEAILEQPLDVPEPMPVFVPPQPVVRAAPKVAGVKTTERWDAEVVSLLELVRAVAAGKAPLAMLQANLTVIRAQARSLKGECRLPGVRVFSVQGIAAGAR